jgi:anti-sigma B factor antagonist/stage II sporulation protein AA (anti-sigma F factor antagonist)
MMWAGPETTKAQGIKARTLEASKLSLSEEVLPGGIQVIAAAGDLDVYTAPDLKAAALHNFPSVEGLVVDLLAVRFLDSTGITALLDLKRRAKLRGVPLAVVCPPTDVWNRFTLQTVEQLLVLRETRDEAVAFVRGRALPV